MTILIADDDKNIRFALKSMLFDILGETTLIEEARNGTEFIDTCTGNPPDIAFVDIQMPELDGITAITHIKQYAVSTLFVILTGYSNFEYARRCVSLGVLDYLLKPVDTDTLRKTLEKAQEEMLRSHKIEQSLFQTKVLTFAHYYPYIGDEIDSADEPPYSGRYIVFSFMFIFPPSAQTSFFHFKLSFITKLNAYAASSFGVNSLFTVYFTETGFLRLIVRTDKENFAECIAQHSEIFLKLIDRGTFDVSAVYQTSDTLREAFTKNAEFEKKQYRMLILPNGTVTDADSFSADADAFLQQLWNFHELQESGSETEYRQDFDNFVETYAMLPDSIPLAGVLTYFHFAFDTGDTVVGSWKDCLQILRSVTFHQDAVTCDLTNLIKNYIDKNFTNNLNINQIADQFSITPNYVSSLFHRKTGIKLLDYITSLRMEYAKTLLKKNPNASVKDITFMVGYSNPRYFSLLFKDYTGMLPTQFRKSH